MEIRPKNTLLSDALLGVLAEIDARISKEEIMPIKIESRDQYVDVAEKLKVERADAKWVEGKLQPFANIAFRIHRAITGKTNEYVGYTNQRATIYDSALVDFDNELERLARETEDNLRKQAATEDEQRRRNDAAELTARGNTAAAEAVMKEPPRPVHVAVEKGTPKVAGHGFKKRWIGTCEDEDVLLKAVARPAIYREIAAWLKADIGPKANKLAAELERRAGEFPVIPSSIFYSTKGAIEALNTKITANANATNGKIDWPGVAVTEDKKSTTRTK